MYTKSKEKMWEKLLQSSDDLLGSQEAMSMLAQFSNKEHHMALEIPGLKICHVSHNPTMNGSNVSATCGNTT